MSGARHALMLALMLTLAGGLAACGKKGPLEPPPAFSGGGPALSGDGDG